MTTSQQRALSGTTAGAAGGAIFGAIAGNAGLGAGIDHRNHLPRRGTNKNALKLAMADSKAYCVAV